MVDKKQKPKPIRRYTGERALGRNLHKITRRIPHNLSLSALKAAVDMQHAKGRASQEQRIGEYLHVRELRRLFFHDRIKLPVELVKNTEEVLRRQGGELGRRGPGQRSVFGLHRQIARAEVRAALRQAPPVFA